MVPSLPLITRPVVPSSEIQSPPLKQLSFHPHLAAFSSTSISPAPATQHLPMPRVTTAAWLVMPRVSQNSSGDFHAVDVFRSPFPHAPE